MKIVGDYLQKHAQQMKQPLEKDIFGRSAINRFYYGAFLITREMLGDFDPGWRQTPHKNMPDKVISLSRQVAKKLEPQLKSGLITHGFKASTLTTIKTATVDLSDLLKYAYELRVVADYKPEELIVINNKILLLKDCSLNTAGKWPSKASAYCKSIRKVWRDSGVA